MKVRNRHGGNASGRSIGGGNFWERSLLISSILALVLLACGLAMVSPANAVVQMSGAEKLRRLDLMLMVTGLRCRTTRSDFQADYGRFVTHHRQMLRRANAQLRTELGVRLGARRGQWAYDKLSTAAANDFGLGHPWLDCGELKSVAHHLTGISGRQALEHAADQLLAESGSAQELAFAE